jgi:hypothetical protein
MELSARKKMFYIIFAEYFVKDLTGGECPSSSYYFLTGQIVHILFSYD